MKIVRWTLVLPHITPFIERGNYMKRTREVVHPIASFLIVTPASIIGGICFTLILFDALFFVISKISSLPNLSDVTQISDYRLCIYIIAFCSLLIPLLLKHALIHKEYDGEGYINAYLITPNYVLPHVSEITFTRNNECLLVFHVCLTYSDIEWILERMRKNHKVSYHAIGYNIPGTTCHTKIGISRHTAELILSEMQTEQFVVVETTLSSTGNPSCEAEADARLTAHFICANDIEILESIMAQAKTSRLEVSIDLEQTMAMNKKYLELCSRLMHGPWELIFLPPKELANSLH